MESGMHEPSPRERLLARCAEIRDEYGLTERETEFLTLIVQGKTRSEIERELFVSQNTVKTHARHLYAKLDVHSKEEARKLVGIELPDRSASDRDM
jgi:ATP/maltotriose-dependent transcriptional regulator MalT